MLEGSSETLSEHSPAALVARMLLAQILGAEGGITKPATAPTRSVSHARALPACAPVGITFWLCCQILPRSSHTSLFLLRLHHDLPI